MTLIEFLLFISVVVNVVSISLVLDYNKYIKTLEKDVDDLIKQRDSWYLRVIGRNEQLELPLEEDE